MARRRRGALVLLVAAGIGVPATAQQARELEAAGMRACQWLDATVAPPTWLRGTSGNARCKRLVAESLAAWTLLVRTPADAAPPARFADLERALAATVAGQGIEDAAFACWLLGGAAFPLAEATLRDGAAHELLPPLVARLGALRNSERVWAHGSMEGTVPGYPSTVVAATNWVVTALAFAAAHGVEVPPPWLDAGADLLAAVQAPNGGIPYGGRPYRIGIEAGRTAGTVVALAAAGRGATPSFTRAANYLWRNARLVPSGHASPAMHVWNGALAAFALGDVAWQRYASEVLARVVAAQRDDGSFDDLAGPHSPDTMLLMGDELSGRAYVTALYGAALLVPQSRLGAWLRGRVSFVPPAAADAGSAVPVPVWRAVVGETRAIASSGEQVFVLRTDRELAAYHLADGRELWRTPVPIDLAAPAALTVRGTWLVGWSREGGPIVVFDLAARRLVWHGHVALAPFASVRFVDARFCAVTPNGTLVVRRLDDGGCALATTLPTGLKRSVVPLANGTFLAAADARLVCLDRDGEVVWRGRNRSDTAQVAATWSQLVATGEVFWGGSTDGALVCRRVDSGDLVWSRQLDGGVVQLARDDANGGLAALTAGGVLSVFDARGALRWSADVSDGRQDPEGAPSRLVAMANGPWVHATGREVLCRFSWDGSPRLELPVDAVAPWVVADERLAIVRDSALCLFASN